MLLVWIKFSVGQSLSSSTSMTRECWCTVWVTVTHMSRTRSWRTATFRWVNMSLFVTKFRTFKVDPQSAHTQCSPSLRDSPQLTDDLTEFQRWLDRHQTQLRETLWTTTCKLAKRRQCLHLCRLLSRLPQWSRKSSPLTLLPITPNRSTGSSSQSNSKLSTSNWFKT